MNKLIKWLTSDWAKATYDMIGGIVSYYCGFALIKAFDYFVFLTAYQAVPGIMIIGSLILFTTAGMLIGHATFRIWEVWHS